MTVHMRHPDLPEEQQIEVGESAVPVHRAAGWVVVEPKPAPVPISKPSAGKRRRAVSDEENV